MTDYVTADWHLGHSNIIKYCNRPFKTVDEMDAILINNVNEVVSPSDRLFNLGDVGFKGADEKLPGWLNRINCKNIYVVPGNHDKEHVLRKYFKVLPQCYMYEASDLKIVFCHYAMRVWPKSHHGVYHLYGHSHGTLPPILGAPAFDVGVDSWNYKPLSMSQVKIEMKRLISLGPEYVVDHHGRK